jgi:hypothetical protein
MSNAELLPAGDDFLGLGADQFTSPQKIALGKFVSSENTICRGGIVKTRPGSKSMLTLPDGNFQGTTLFKPASGIPHIVSAVDGFIYVSPYPFTEYRLLEGIQFNASTQYVAWAVCLKSTEYNEAGELYFLENPYSVLMMQDGKTRAAYWDGAVGQHLNPGPSPVAPIVRPGYDETPVGLWMAWANNRLWVSRGNQVFASDIGNPLKFTEGDYINEGRAFYLPEVCTGIAATTDQQGIVCFTEQTGTFLLSSLQDRTQWLTTPGFQKDILPSVGCVAPRSIVPQYGMLWWYSSRGLINQDDALRANITSRLNIQDNPMFATKANMSFNLSGVCGCSYENMMLVSVPYGDKLNRRTMVLDQAPFGEEGAQVNAWASYWTGWRPVEWATGVVNGEERIFFGSVDYDGKNRIWEVGTSDSTDNGVPITCNLITRDHLFGSRDYKKLNYIEAELCGVKDEVSFMISAAGLRGAWQPIGRKEIVSTYGQIYGDAVYGEGANELAGTSEQTRVLRSANVIDASACNAACVESDNTAGLIDKAFSVMFTWSGICGISAYRMFAVPDSVFYGGDCETNEEGPRLLNDEGCGAKERFLTSTPFEMFNATATYSQKNPVTAKNISYTATASSIISQEDADRKAALSARAAVTAQL